MSATLITADLHLSDHPRDEYRHEFMASLPAFAQERDIDRILLLGDITEEKDCHSARLVNRIIDHLYALTRVVDSVVILRGNHDAATPDWPFFRFARRMSKVTWINKPRIIGAELFLPHTTDYRKDWGDIDMRQCQWIYAHNAFQGAHNENGTALDGIPTTVFPRGAKVIAGDVHVPQTLDCVTYVGAPYTVKFGDTFDPRLLIINGGKVISTRSWGPRKRLLNYYLGEPLGGALGFDKGDILKIRVHLKPEKTAQWWEIRQGIYSWGELHGFVIDGVEPVADVRIERAKPHTSTVKRVSDEELLRTYAKRHDIDKRTLTVGLSLMKES